MGSQRDFDFAFGSWTVHNRKLRNIADLDCTEWVEFDAISEAWPVLDGLGNVDRIYISQPADGGPPFEGFTLRLYEPAEDIWRIWWSSTRQPGRLDTPVSGRFEGGRGVFESSEVISGRPVRVRFQWLVEDPAAPTWEQAFSFDDGQNWRPNWTMQLRPRSPAGASET